MSLNKNIFYTFLTQFPTLLLSLGTGVLITRILGAEGRGVYALFQANIQLFVLLLGLSLNAGMVYFLSNRKIKRKSILGIGIYTITVAAAVLAGILFFLSTGWHSELLFPEEYNSAFFFYYLFFSFLLTLVNLFFSGVFQGHQNFKTVNLLTVVNGLLNTCVFGWLYLEKLQGGDWVNIQVVFTASLSLLLANFLLWFSAYSRKYGFVPRLKLSLKEEFLPFYRYIGTSHLSNVINFLNYRLDVWIILYFCELKTLGIYTLAVTTAQVLWLISNPLATVLFPHLSASKNNTNVIRTYSRINTSLVVLVALPLLILCDPLLPLIYGEEFTASILPFRILVIGVIFSCITKPFAALLAAENKVIFNLWATVVGLVLTIALDLLLIPTHGAIGASWATAVVYFFICVTVLYFSAKKAGIPWGNYFLITLKDLKSIKFSSGK